MTAKHLYLALLALAFVALNGCAPSGDPGDEENPTPNDFSAPMEMGSEMDFEDDESRL